MTFVRVIKWIQSCFLPPLSDEERKNRADLPISNNSILFPLVFHAAGRGEHVKWNNFIFTSCICAALTLSKFPFWLLMMKCKNNTRSCVPTCLPEYSTIMDNSRILQPLQPAAALLPSGSYSLFNKISRRGLWFFRITQVQKQRAITSIFIFRCTKSHTGI